MTKNKTTKRALLVSVLALLLCASLLVGSTFAWFTDNVTSTNNIIKSGNLDVKLEYSTTMEDGSWNEVGANTDIFKNEDGTTDLWEPGFTEVVYLKVSNVGSLALKYALEVTVASEKQGTNQAGEKFSLSQYIKYDVVKYTAEKPFANRDAAVAAVPNAVALKTGIPAISNVSLEPKTENTIDSDVLALVVYMPTTVGNVANHNGEDIPTINLGITLNATQLAYEEDSFGPDYDEDAVYGTYVELNEGDDLLAAMASAEAGLPLTIKLNGDVEWPTDGHHDENDITPASSIVINGNGYTITATGSGVTPLGDDKAPMTLKNVEIVDNSVSYDESAWELSYLELGGRVLNCVNVTFVDPVIVDGDKSTFTDCTFTGHYDKNSTSTTQYGVWAYNGDSTYTNCTFTGTRGMKICDQYSGEVGTVVVDGCTFNNISEKPGVVIDNRGEGDVSSTEGMTVIIKNSTFINCKAGDQGLYIYETDNTVPTLENNNVLNNATIVSTKDELLALSAKVLTGNNGTAEEAIIVIGADIDMAGAEFSAIIAQRGDKLTVLGNGHTISNVKIVSGANDNTTGQASMFYAYPDSTLTVSNLTLKDVTVTAEANGSGYAAAVVGYCEGEAILNNVDVVNATVTGVKSSGMLVGHLSGSLTATNCDLSGSVTLADFAEEANGHYAGKYVGTLAGAMTLTDCTANVTVSGNLSAKNLGDIYGRKTAAGSSNVEFAKNDTDFGTAIAGGADTVILGSGNYVIPAAAQGKTLTIIGTGDTSVAVTKVGSGGENCDFGLDGSTVTFENVTITTNSSTYIGYARCNGTYKNCTFNGTYTLYGNSVFENCTFNVSGDVYNLWTWGAPTATFTGCTFNSDGKAMLLYGTVNTKLTVNDCTFNDNGGLADLKAAIEIGNDYGKSYELIVNNTTVNGYEINDKGISTGTTLWANKNSMGTDKLNVVVDGVDKY